MERLPMPRDRALAIFPLLLLCTTPSAPAEELRFRNSEQRDVVPEGNIVDGTWIVIGNSPRREGHVFRDATRPRKGCPVYRFRADSGAVNRIEFSEAFGSAANLAGLSKEQVGRVLAAGAASLNVDVGRFGDTVTYAWSTRFPRPLGPDSRGIVAQWHGRPDRTLVRHGGTLRRLTGTEFARLLEVVDFRDDRCGYDRKTGEKTDYRVDGAAGGPIGALKIGDSHLYLIVRSDRARLSTSEVKLKPKPSQPIGHRLQDGTKEASLVWKLPLADVPVGEWMDFTVRIRYSEYDLDADRVLTQGAVAVWLDGKPVADWKGNVGKNDLHGPYFKFGIYKPGDEGLEVEHAAYRRTIDRTRKSPVPPDPLTQ